MRYDGKETLSGTGVWYLSLVIMSWSLLFFFFQAEDGIRDLTVTGVQTCALPISAAKAHQRASSLRIGGCSLSCGPSGARFYDMDTEPTPERKPGPIAPSFRGVM